MPTILMTIAYDGSRYAGWQRQLGADTVQQQLERACERVFGGPIHVEGAGRTDAGVHAIGQTAHAVVPRELPPRSLRLALNGNLPADIAVRAVRTVADGFHARFAASGKRYVYRCVTSHVRPAIGRAYYHWVRRRVDLLAMRRAARLLVGRHDFAAFASNPGYERRRGTVRTIQHLHLWQRPWGFDLAIQGDGFLYNMVRAIAGTLLDVGTGRIDGDRLAAILQGRDRGAAGATAPARGLYLLRVLYPDGPAATPGCAGPAEDVC